MCVSLGYLGWVTQGQSNRILLHRVVCHHPTVHHLYLGNMKMIFHYVKQVSIL